MAKFEQKMAILEFSKLLQLSKLSKNNFCKERKKFYFLKGVSSSDTATATQSMNIEQFFIMPKFVT